MTEWLKVADCKSVGYSYIGSNPIFFINRMPQFDKITFFNQIFWLLITFFGFYFIILKSLLPVLAAGLKTRKKIMNFIFLAGSSSSENSSRKSYYTNLQKFLKTHKTLSTSLAQKQSSNFPKFRLSLLGQTFSF